MSTRLGAAARPGAAPHGAHKPSIVVKLDSHYNAKVYTSGSKITGQVEILSQHDVQFDDFEIVFTGVSSSRLDFVQQFTSHSWRPFMKLRMPLEELEEGQMPDDKVFRARQRYIIPFNFVVPHQLTIGACSHNVVNHEVQQQHLRMPPSVGCWEHDDMAPEMAQVQYAIKARAIRNVAGLEEPLKLMVAEHVLKVLPSSPEDAPLDVSFRDESYKLMKTKTIRKSLFSPKTGKLSADTAQPGAVMLSADGLKATGSSARVNLQFVPDSPDTAPPKINSVSAKIQVTTYFSGGAVDHLPNLGGRSCYHATPSLNYANTLTLINNKPVETVSWTEELLSQHTRRDSGYSSYADESTDSDNNGRSTTRRSSNSKGKSGKKTSPIRHTATVDVPFTLPTGGKKVWLPSFHNCLISRVYSIHLTLSVGPTNTAVTLVLPLQIGVETLHEPQGGGELPSFEDAMAHAEAEEANTFFQPRLMQIPQMSQQSMLPGYEEMGRRTVAVA